MTDAISIGAVQTVKYMVGDVSGKTGSTSWRGTIRSDGLFDTLQSVLLIVVQTVQQLLLPLAFLHTSALAC